MAGRGNAPIAGANDSLSFSDYMRDKKAKLSDQYSSESLENSLSPEHAARNGSLFRSVCIHINGYTSPSLQELRKMVIQGGGRYETYFSSRVTHLVATNLPPSTIRRCKDGQIIVTPNWIIDSIEKNMLLPWSEYTLDHSSMEGNTAIPLSKTFQASHTIPDRTTDPPKSDTIDTSNPIIDQTETRLHDCTDKNFLANYFKNSRLHHLSEWKKQFQEDLFHEIKPWIDCSPEVEGATKIFFHVDMDCFFASVALRFHPEYHGLPLAVSHSTNPNGSADIAACNYEARAFGVKNGMWVRSAIRLCPQLTIVGYDFEKYEKISKILFQVLLRYSQKIDIISCDEAFMDVSNIEDPKAIAKALRKEIFDLTGCTASVGIGENRLLARIATKQAKPDGQYHITPEETSSFLSSLKVRELPGIGRKFEEKLARHKIEKIRDLLPNSLLWLQNEFGKKSGETLFFFARGIDKRNFKEFSALQGARKSIGVDCNWGVRLSSVEDTFLFLLQLTQELRSRLLKASYVIGSLALQVRIRKPDEPVIPSKYLGTGRTDNYSRSVDFQPQPTASVNIIHAAVTKLFTQIRDIHHFSIEDIRGIGLHGNKLTHAGVQEIDHNERKRSSKHKTISQSFPRIKKVPAPKKQKIAHNETILKPPKKAPSFPTLSQVDQEVLGELPEDLQKEIRDTLKPSKATLNMKKYKMKAIYVDDSHEVEYYKQFSSPSPSYAAFTVTMNDFIRNNNPNVHFIEKTIQNMIQTNLEDAQKSLRLAKNICNQQGWNSIYQIVEGKAKITMLQRYGGLLVI